MGRIYENGGLSQRIEEVLQASEEGKLPFPPQGHDQDPAYIAANLRPSAYRRNAPDGLLQFFDVMDLDIYFDTQYNAPQGVLNPDSPFFGQEKEYSELEKRLREK